MRKIFLIILITNRLYAEGIPEWAHNGSLEDDRHRYAICSSEGFDLYTAKSRAQEKCITSILNDIKTDFIYKGKLSQSMNGISLSETFEFKEISAKIPCVYEKFQIDKVKDGFVVWLKCTVLKDNIKILSIENKDDLISTQEKNTEIKNANKIAKIKILSNVIPDSVTLNKRDGTFSIINPDSIETVVEIDDLVESISAKKIGYQDKLNIINKFNQNDFIMTSFELQRINGK